MIDWIWNFIPCYFPTCNPYQLRPIWSAHPFCNRDRTIWFQLLLGSGVFCFLLSYPSFCFSVLSPAFPRRCWNILCNSSHPDPLTICTFPAKQQKNRKEIQNQKYEGSISNLWQKSRWCGTDQTNDVIGLLWYEVKIFQTQMRKSKARLIEQWNKYTFIILSYTSKGIPFFHQGVTNCGLRFLAGTDQTWGLCKFGSMLWLA